MAPGARTRRDKGNLLDVKIASSLKPRTQRINTRPWLPDAGDRWWVQAE